MIICLIFIVLITIALVGFVSTAGLERKTVNSHFGRMQAQLYDSMATEIVASRLEAAIDPARAWITAPGRIASVPLAGGPPTLIDLFSGTASAVVKDVSIDLNPKAFTRTAGLMTKDDTVVFPVSWVYVREDGMHEVAISAVPTHDATNPVVGRYAFWTDDETARLNLNAATSRDAINSPYTAALDLEVLEPLGGTDVSALLAERQTRLFDTLAEAKAAADSVTLRTALDDNEFSVTHNSRTPEINIFNEPRIVLTTQEGLATESDGSVAPFIDILTGVGVDPGAAGNVDPGKMEAAFLKIYNLLKRTDWPTSPGMSFVDKYGKRNAAQFVLNLIDYVRSAESSMLEVDATRGQFDEATEVFSDSLAPNTSNKGLMGNARRLLITQLGVWFSSVQVGVPPAYQVKFYVEVCLPESAGDASNTLSLTPPSNRTLQVEIDGAVSMGNSVPEQTISASNLFSVGFPLGPLMKPGDYRTLEMTFSGTEPPPPVGSALTLRAAIRPPGSNVSADIVPLHQGGVQIPYVTQAPGGMASNIESVSVDDPAVNKSGKDWSQGSNTFGRTDGSSIRLPASTVGSAATGGLPQQDTDGHGNIADVGVRFPAVKGASKNPDGLVRSLAELGRISTGGAGELLKGVPWRTLRLQPRKAAADTFPDWAVLDLFRVTNKAKELDGLNARETAALQPRPFSASGPINVNTVLYPFSEMPGQMQRTVPLQAVTRSDAGLSDAEASTIADQIAGQTLATGTSPGRAYPIGPGADADLVDSGLFWMPGQISEIKDTADSGEGSESRLENFLPLLTSRGSVFSVFSVGQKIRQLPNGTIKVLGETRARTLLESVWAFDDPSPGDKKVEIKVVSTQELGL